MIQIERDKSVKSVQSVVTGDKPFANSPEVEDWEVERGGGGT
jgi:hypothetical protein